MILDALLEMSDAQAVTATAISTNVIDLGPVADNPTRDIGTGEDVYWVISVDTTFTGLTSLQASLVSDTTAGLQSAPVTHATTIAIPVAALIAGYQYAVKLPGGSYKQYLGTQFTVVGTGTAGKINSFLSKDVQAYRAYADRQPIAPNA